MYIWYKRNDILHPVNMAFYKLLKMFITEYFNGWMRWKFTKFVSKFMYKITWAAEEIIIALLKYLQSVQRGRIRIKFTKQNMLIPFQLKHAWITLSTSFINKKCAANKPTWNSQNSHLNLWVLDLLHSLVVMSKIEVKDEFFQNEYNDWE